ncbi:hypothetical protein [Streptomyces sp. NPDC057702]|uniref:hypothetical protein n=1 Tax=unclassified Streptomyces TaxID=2593676 RepID=UPI0036AD6D87
MTAADQPPTPTDPNASAEPAAPVDPPAATGPTPPTAPGASAQPTLPTVDPNASTEPTLPTAGSAAPTGSTLPVGAVGSAGARPAPAFPDAARADAGLATFSTWRVGTPERQRAAVDAIAAAWERLPWPTPDLLGYSVYTATDGETLAHYAQWTSEAAYERYAATRSQATHLAAIDAAVPGIERVGVTPYRLYRTARTPGARETSAPGAVIAVDIEFDGPDEARLRRWVDGWFDGDEPEVDDFDGLLAAHFHVSVDGTRVLNYAEWVSVQAHVEALAALHATHDDQPAEPTDPDARRIDAEARTDAEPGARTAPDAEARTDADSEVGGPGSDANQPDPERAGRAGVEGDQWDNQLAFPGLTSTSFRRYRLSWSATAPASG